ncbi:MAG: glycerophosphodiester phosphodiesterase family protein, partial [Anaerolineae bacterium]|nr:glycerophosphodiester phosphodiesterase family protein [Anaerolineae bacterium]
MKPLILAHRGASAYAPENTLAAFNLAFELGADGIELDVSLTRDGIPVVIHDDTVDRTTNGHGAVNQFTLAELQQLDASNRMEKYRGEKIPTLEEVLRAVGTRGLINIEIKSTGLKTDGVEMAVLAAIENTGASRVLISSFNPLALRRMLLLDPRLPRGLLYAPRLPIFLRRAWLRPLVRPAALHPHFSMVTREWVQWAHARGYQVNTWTVDDPEVTRRLIEWGVDSLSLIHI